MATATVARAGKVRQDGLRAKEENYLPAEKRNKKLDEGERRVNDSIIHLFYLKTAFKVTISA